MRHAYDTGVPLCVPVTLVRPTVARANELEATQLTFFSLSVLPTFCVNRCPPPFPSPGTAGLRGCVVIQLRTCMT